MPLFVTVTPGTTVTSSTTLDAATLNLLGTPSVDVTGTVDGGSLSISAGSVPLTSLVSQANATLVGNGSGASASPVALSSTDLTFTASTVNIGTGAVVEGKIGARAVQPGKLFSLDGTLGAKILGRYTASSGDVETLTLGSNMTVSGGALNTLRPVVIFTNVESTASYTLPSTRASAIELSALTTSITPQAASSKVLIQFNFSCEVNNTASGAQIKQAFILERVIGATVTPIGVPSSPENRIYGTKVMPYDGDNVTTQSNIVISFVDSPSTTSAVTYRIKAYTGPASGASQVLYLNGTINQTNADYNTRSTSQVILQEILV
jgi:hypothetical protein